MYFSIIMYVHIHVVHVLYVVLVPVLGSTRVQVRVPKTYQMNIVKYTKHKKGFFFGNNYL